MKLARINAIGEIEPTRIGIIGGMSPEATIRYCKLITEKFRKRSKNHTAPDLIVRSINPEVFHVLMQSNKWNHIEEQLALETRKLINLDNCDHIALASNTLHKAAPAINAVVDDWSNYYCSNFINIGDCIAKQLQAIGARRILLLGTKPVMTGLSMKRYLSKKYDIEIMGVKHYPNAVSDIDYIISEQLRHGIRKKQSKEYLVQLIRQFVPSPKFPERPEAVVLASTELGMLIKSKDIDGIPVIDSAEVHARAIVESC